METFWKIYLLIANTSFTVHEDYTSTTQYSRAFIQSHTATPQQESRKATITEE